MGQRLIISVETMGEPIAKIYYHWSAYTTSALYATKKVIGCIYNHQDETVKELQLRLIRFCERNGGCIRGDDREFQHIQKMFPNEIFAVDGSRNYGLIAISKDGMEGLQSWSEGDVVIDIDNDLIYFSVCWSYENLERYIEERKEWDDDFDGITLEEIPDIGYDLGCIDIQDIDNVAEEIYNVKDGICRFRNEIYELIE